MMEKIWPILLQTSIIWVPLLFMVRREYKRATSSGRAWKCKR